ncbi:MAG: hypothetical protein IJC31_06165 [Spirochaetaceae bacterium]|nr:hypothetical protein [Spirochaetaceae bacterium]
MNSTPVIQLNRQPYNRTVRPKRYHALNITCQEGSFIKYKLACGGWTVTAVADVVGVQHSLVSNVLAGRRHSRAVEARIAAILGYQDWNQMVLAIRSIMAA